MVEWLHIDLPSAYCDVWELHDDFRQEPTLERSIHKLVHRHIGLDQNRFLGFIEPQDVVERADINNLIALARRVSC